MRDRISYDRLNKLIATRVITTAELTEQLINMGIEPEEIPKLIELFRTTQRKANLLAERMRYEGLSRRKAYKELQADCPWLSEESLDTLISDGLFATR